MTADAGSYFVLDPDLRATSAGRYLDVDGLSPVEFVEGLVFRPVIAAPGSPRRRADKGRPSWCPPRHGLGPQG